MPPSSDCANTVDVVVRLPAAVVGMSRFRCALVDETLDAFVLESVLRRFDRKPAIRRLAT